MTYGEFMYEGKAAEFIKASQRDMKRRFLNHFALYKTSSILELSADADAGAAADDATAVAGAGRKKCTLDP